MKLTQEQQDILGSLDTDDKVIKVNAYAGTGKTSTIIELIKEIKRREPSARILYTVFNKSMKEEALGKFEKAGLDVDCYTVHGLAYRRYRIMSKTFNKVIPSIYGDEYLSLANSYYKVRRSYIDYERINKLFTAFTTSTITMKDFVDYIVDSDYASAELVTFANEKGTVTPDELDFFEDFYSKLLNRGLVTHGMYLYEYSMNYYDPIKEWDYVFIDEAQDLNAHMFNILKRMVYKKMFFFGDTYQQIYTWAKAVNAMEKIRGAEYPLSMSFRLNNECRKIADELLSVFYESYQCKPHITNSKNNTKVDDEKQVTYLFRTNAAMLRTAVYLLMETDEEDIKVHFWDVIKGESTDSFDKTFGSALYLYNKLEPNNKLLQKEFNIPKSDPMVDMLSKRMKREKYTDSLFNYCKLCVAKETIDGNIANYFKLYEAFGDDITSIMVRLKRSQSIKNPSKEYWLCTAHRSKGLEWENVVVAPDRWSLSTIDDLNLLYVACTRATKTLDYTSVLNTLLADKARISLPKECMKRLAHLENTLEPEELERNNFYQISKAMAKLIKDKEDCYHSKENPMVKLPKKEKPVKERVWSEEDIEDFSDDENEFKISYILDK